MNETNESGPNGWTKLFHPKGALVTLPVPADPAAALAHVSKCLDLGWTVAAPGLEEGELKKEVGHVLRGSSERDGEITPFLLLYSTEEGHTFSFLKVYLNKIHDVESFEFASKMRFLGIPEYVGNDKPEMGKSAKLDAFIVKVPRPFSVVLKNNPKYDETAKAAAASKGEIYKIPRRVFIRWADQKPTGETTKTDNGGQSPLPNNSKPVPAAKDLGSDLDTNLIAYRRQQFAKWADIADRGTDNLRRTWASTTAIERSNLGREFLDQLKKLAEEADAASTANKMVEDNPF